MNLKCKILGEKSIGIFLNSYSRYQRGGGVHLANNRMSFEIPYYGGEIGHSYLWEILAISFNI
jgi:hypothetical protein